MPEHIQCQTKDNTDDRKFAPQHPEKKPREKGEKGMRQKEGMPVEDGRKRGIDSCASMVNQMETLYHPREGFPSGRLLGGVT